MKRFQAALFLATASSALVAGAQAQTAIPNKPGQSTTAGNDTRVNMSGAPIGPGTEFSLLGAGATSVQNLLVQEANCIGGNNVLGNSNGTTTTIAEPTALATPAGAFNCSTQSLQPNFSAKYVGTGSGFGRQAWRSSTNQFGGTVLNPLVVGTNIWQHLQFAFGDSTLLATDITAYNTNVAPYGGPAVQFPKYVLPVAIAYNPIYGSITDATTGVVTQFNFNVNNTTTNSINGTNVGGLKLSRELYCGIFNGNIKNFNDSRFATANGGTSLRDTDDDSTRWTNDGVPIRLVGRLEKSGTTDIFTRALASQCGGFTGITNKYLNNAESLPYSRGASNTPDFTTVRSDSAFRAAATDPLAGTTNLISNQYFNGTVITSSGVTGGGTAATPVGNQGSGLFLVAIGSGLVRDAINLAPDYALGGVVLNGKIGYISSDFIANSPTGSATLFAAALQLNRTTGAYNLPSALNGRNAARTIRPPESTSTTDGTYTNTDDRNNRSAVAVQREDPLSWYDVLYATSATQAKTLADPGAGYPITGTTQFFGNTCYTAQNREQIVNFLGWNTDGVTRDSANANRNGIFTSVSATTPGLLDLSNISAMPDAWKTAIVQTFLTDSAQTAGGQRLGALNLWLQNQPTPGGNNTANTACTGKTGS